MNLFRKILILSLLFQNCKNETTKAQMNNQTLVAFKDTVKQYTDTIIPENSIPCSLEGEIVKKFEQNDAVFEILYNENKELKWLKTTTKDGKCKTEEIKIENHYSCSFEDWDEDGFKDKIEHSRYSYEVSLFDKIKNDFSRHINGDFSGEQWDFDKTKHIKYQYFDLKFDAAYELYQLKDTVKTVLCRINFQSPHHFIGLNTTKILIFKEAPTKENQDGIVIQMDQKLKMALKKHIENDFTDGYGDDDVRNIFVEYWKENLALFLH